MFTSFLPLRDQCKRGHAYWSVREWRLLKRDVPVVISNFVSPRLLGARRGEEGLSLERKKRKKKLATKQENTKLKITSKKREEGSMGKCYHLHNAG